MHLNISFCQSFFFNHTESITDTARLLFCGCHGNGDWDGSPSGWICRMSLGRLAISFRQLVDRRRLLHSFGTFLSADVEVRSEQNHRHHLSHRHRCTHSTFFKRFIDVVVEIVFLLIATVTFVFRDHRHNSSQDLSPTEF